MYVAPSWLQVHKIEVSEWLSTEHCVRNRLWFSDTHEILINKTLRSFCQLHFPASLIWPSSLVWSTSIQYWFQEVPQEQHSSHQCLEDFVLLLWRSWGWPWPECRYSLDLCIKSKVKARLHWWQEEFCSKGKIPNTSDGCDFLWLRLKSLDKTLLQPCAREECRLGTNTLP